MDFFSISLQFTMFMLLTVNYSMLIDYSTYHVVLTVRLEVPGTSESSGFLYFFSFLPMLIFSIISSCLIQTHLFQVTSNLTLSPLMVRLFNSARLHCLLFKLQEIQTFMSVDADRTVNTSNSFHDMWSLPLQIGIALYLLYTQVQVAFVTGITIIILLIPLPVNKWIVEMIASATKNMMGQKDERCVKLNPQMQQKLKVLSQIPMSRMLQRIM